MKTFLRKCLSALCAGALLLSLLPALALAAWEQGAFQKASGHLESAYIEWAPVEGATGYRVYVKPAAGLDSEYKQIDDQLVRRYPTYWRADALGLSAGSYVMKVTPVKDGTDMDALVTGPLTVLAQDRSGYAFAKGNVPGAYSMDGTLKQGAKVVYVTNDNKNSVKLGGYTGFQNIVKNADKIGGAIDVRVLGKVTGLSGDLLNIKTTKAQLTVEGVGNDATAYGWGFGLSGCSHVELRNLAIMLVAGGDLDGVTVDSCQYIWVHNCEFFYNKADPSESDKKKGDGSLDTKKSHYVTHSYNHFWDSGKCNLQGSSTSDTSDWITYHHNWYDHSDSRHPRVRVAHVHVFNNYYDHNDNYGIGAVYHATVFADRNYFDGCQYPMLISQQGSDPGFFSGNSGTGESGGMMKAYGNIVKNGKYVPWSASNKVEFDAYEVDSPDAEVPGDVKSKSASWTYDNFDTKSDFYAYTAHAAEDVPAKVKTYAGRVEGGDFTYDMSTLKSGNAYPDEGLLAKMQSYTCDLVSVGGGDTGGGGETPDPGPGPDPGPTPDPGSEIVGGATYTLTGNEVYALMAEGKGPSSFKNNSSYPGSYYTSAQTSHKAGTDNFFTLRYAGSSRIDPVPISFPAPNAFEGEYRINFNGYATANTNCVEFTTNGPASVKVWWTGGVAAGEDKALRPVVVMDEGGAVVGTSETVDNSTTPMVTQFSLADAGTYRLGGKGGKNFIYKVTVTVGSTLGGLPWSLDGDKVAVSGEIPSGEQVWAACWDSADRFLGVHALDAQNEARLDETWARFKLLWLNAKEAPKCSAVEAHK